MAKKPIFEVGQTVTLGKEKYCVVSTGLTVRGGRDTIGPPGVYGTVLLEHLATGKKINWLGVLLEKRIQEEQHQLKEKQDKESSKKQNKSKEEDSNGRKRTKKD